MRQGFDVSLPVNILKEGKVFVAYTPALDLSTVGDTFDEVKKKFEEAVQLFMDELVQEGKLEQAMEELGWQKINNGYSAPSLVSSNTETFNVAFAN